MHSFDEKHVLVVDDDRQIQQTVCKLLRGAGYQYHTAGAGATGFYEFAAHPIDLVITDLNMPGGDGFVLINRIRQVNADVPILVTTSMHRSVLKSLRITDIANLDVFNKPLNPSLLMARVEAILPAA